MTAAPTWTGALEAGVVVAVACVAVEIMTTQLD